MLKPVAFFDIDGTLFRSSLLIELVDELIVVGLFPVSAKTEYEPAYLAWQARTGTYEDYIGAIISTFLTHITGVYYSDFADIGRRIVAKKGDRVYRFTRDYVQELKMQGYALIAISQSPKIILDDFCYEYGFDKVYGRMYAIDSADRFTGKTIDEHIIENKGNIVERVFARHPEFTQDGSIAVGDTEGDISLLERVNKPVCFNPNQALYHHARTHGWRIVVERKDVVYYL